MSPVTGAVLYLQEDEINHVILTDFDSGEEVDRENVLTYANMEERIYIAV